MNPFALLLALVVVAIPAGGVKFDLPASPTAGNVRCVSQFFAKDVLVVGEVSLGPGEDQTVSIEVVDETPSASVYHNKKDLADKSKFSFTTHSQANYRFCFTNNVMSGRPVQPGMFRTVSLSVESGHDTDDFSELIEKEKLAPLEVDLLKLEKALDSIVHDMEQSRIRETSMRDTNELTQDRVKHLTTITMFVLVALGGWQVWYLRKFLRSKNLI